MENNYNEWIKLSLYGRQEDVEILTAVISMIENGVMIEDYSDVSTDGLYGALIDESILTADKTPVTVSVFLPADRSLAEAKAFLSERIAEDKIPDLLPSESNGKRFCGIAVIPDTRKIPALRFAQGDTVQLSRIKQAAAWRFIAS